MLLPASSRHAVVMLDRAALAAGAAPGEADPVETPAMQHVVPRLSPHRPHRYVVMHHLGEPTV